MKKYVLFAFIALFFVSSHSAWAQYVKVTDENGTVSWAKIEGIINGESIEIYKGGGKPTIDTKTKGSIDLNEVWSQSGGSGTRYQVTCIGDGAFVECYDLTSIVFPLSVTYIGYCAFGNCTSLTSIKIPNSVTSIEDYAFGNCTSLTSIEIPSSVTSIGNLVVDGSTGLTSIVVESGNSVYDSRDNCNAIIETASNTLIAGCKNSMIPSSVTSIGDDAFRGCTSLTSITIPNSVTSIGDCAFQHCFNLTSITSYITEVFETGDYNFLGCENATLYVPKGTKSQYQSTADWNRISNIVEMSNNQFDVNSDGSTDISDVVTLVNFILDSSTTNSSYDVNGDGSVDISDVVSLVNTILNGTGTGSDDNSQAYLTCPDENHPHMIDLGLPSGTKWACCNVGADKPEAFGGYYAWGETEEKDFYDLSTSPYYQNRRWVNIGSDIAGTNYDVAYVKWGSSWVMPSIDQITELIDNCSSKNSTFNGVEGIEFTGQNGGTVFLPFAGNRWNVYLDSGGYYWSSTHFKDPEIEGSAYELLLFSGGNPDVNPDEQYAVWSCGTRSDGHSVRPVVSK